MEQDFHWKMRVYYEDTDAGGVVFYANYLKFFERARTEWLRALGVGQHALATGEGILFIVKNTAVDYLAPARLDDQLTLTVHVEKLGRASVSFRQEAWRGDGSAAGAAKLLARGAITVVCVKAENFQPTGIPQHILSSIRNSGIRPALQGPGPHH
jgi:acyl-CoA thioester hydrolase